MMKRFKHLRSLLALCLALALLLCGCRNSPVLEEVVYTYTATEVDYEQEMLDPEDEGQETEDFDNVEQDDLDTERDTEADEGLESDDGEADVAAEVNLNADSNSDLTSDQTTDNTAQTNSTGTGTTTETPAESETTPSETESTPSETETTPGETETGNGGGETNPDTTPSTDVTYKQIVDATGSTVDIPENVETVTAVGAAAQMVEMLGGSGRLIAANSELLSSSLAAAAFSDYSSIQTWWTGDGSSAITDSCFTALLAASPDVCFEISGQNTFTDSQVQQLNEAGIAYFVLPALTSQANLENAVTLVAQVLGTSSTGEDCTDIANSYNAWVESTVSSVSSSTSGNSLTSLYIAFWDSDASYVLNDTKGVLDSSGTGLAVAYSPAKSQLMSTFMSAANVTNESTRANTHKATNYVYVTPMFHQFTPSVSGSLATYYSGAGEYGAAYDLFVARLYSSVYYQLGGSQFPAVIVADSSVKTALENNWFWQYHDSSEDGYIYIDGEKFYRAIVGAYSIYVNPTGMVDWAEGSVESPLEAYWVACKLSGAYTMDEVKSQTSTFYETFFHVTLTNELLNQIFGE